MARQIKQVYSQALIEKIESLMPENYSFNKYYKSKCNDSQYIMRNSLGYIHLMEIVRNKRGYTFNHYRVTEKMLIDTGNRYGYFETLELIKKNIEGGEQYAEM